MTHHRCLKVVLDFRDVALFRNDGNSKTILVENLNFDFSPPAKISGWTGNAKCLSRFFVLDLGPNL